MECRTQKYFIQKCMKKKGGDSLSYEGPRWDTVKIWDYDRFTGKRTGFEPVTYERLPMRLVDAVIRDTENFYGEEPFGEFRDLVLQLEEQNALDEKSSRTLKALSKEASKARRREQKKEMANKIKTYIGEISMGERKK